MKLALFGPVKSAALAVIFGVAILAALHAHAQAGAQKTFSTSKEALDALIQASRDNNSAELQAILGPNSKQILSSGDEVADKRARDWFLTNYEAKHSLVESAPHQLTLNIGKQDWPLPIPLVHAN
jgi:Protein of unknown function (DUF2950)